LYALIGLCVQGKAFQERAPLETVPQTDTGGLVENTKALERSTLKELGKLLS
jgi:hypothetical protein